MPKSHSALQLIYLFVIPKPYHPAPENLERLAYSPLRKTPQRIDTSRRHPKKQPLPPNAHHQNLGQYYVLNASVQLDPITFDGYPANEIQATSRASAIPNTPEGDAQYAMLFAAFDQTLVQILKSMVYDPAKYNQYNLRSLSFPYIDVDYERNGTGDSITDVAKSSTMHLKLLNIHVLIDRTAILSPALLLPHHPLHNPNGVQITYIPRAGHFPATDNPLGVTDTIVNFVRRVMGRNTLADIYVGNDGIWKGDEREMVNDLRVLHNILD